MTEEELRQLQVGDIVRHASAGDAYIVTGNYGDHVTAVRSVDITNAIEWVYLSEANHVTVGR
jgi:hypothetical protein